MPALQQRKLYTQRGSLLQISPEELLVEAGDGAHAGPGGGVGCAGEDPKRTAWIGFVVGVDIARDARPLFYSQEIQALPLQCPQNK